MDKFSYKNFKHLILKNFGETKEQKYILIEQLLDLKQKNLGKANFYTIEFRRLARRIGWPYSVLIDLIKRGLLEDVKKEFDNVRNKPKTLFEVANVIIEVDKKLSNSNKLCKRTILVNNNIK
ncbi:hypothetical protein PIROE2DRAFT_44845 [Piromyces sp. E2]|nr:hypothetical protein PIROE2DRAFT_44845 [Piromyces sp. E2]|eukprot:OUM61901.1 hypothetical protein PIROE2DRAFT_44845 [Piromyces sp. E2]